MSSYSFQYNDLNLDKLEKTQDPKRLVAMLGTLISGDSDAKVLPARQWLESFLYYAGSRNLASRFAGGTVTGNSLGMGANRDAQIYRRRIPKLFKAVQVQASNMTRQRPGIKVWPEDDGEISERKAKLSNIVLDYFWDTDHENDSYYEAMLWALLTPMVARKDYISYEYNRSRLWPVMNDAVDPLTGQPTKEQAFSERGEPILEQLPWNKTEIVSAFRFIVNPMANWLETMDFAADVSIKRIGAVRQQFNRQGEGYYPENLENVKPGSWRFTPAMAMEMALKQLTFGMFRSYRNWNYSNLMMQDGVVQIDLYVKPSPAWPKGRQIVVANGECLYDGDSTAYRESPITMWHPYSILTYERVPGRMWGTSYSEKLLDQQRAYEQARTEMDQLRRSLTKPKIAMPIGAQLDTDTITGNEEIWRYNPFGPAGGVPSFMSAPQPSTVLMDDTKLQAQEWVESSGVTEIMQGIRPQGVTTYRGLEVLREEASNAQNNFIRMFESFMQDSQFNKLENIRRSLYYPDKNLVNALKIFKKMSQYVTDVDVKDFAGSDLAGYVKIEPYSSIGRSKLAQQEKYMNLAQLGVLGNIQGDPDLNNEFKRKMDIMGFDAPSNKQVNLARYENQLMLQSEETQQIINPPVYPWHDDILHMREIENLLLDPTMQEKQFVFQSLLAHYEAHKQQAAQKQAQQMQMQQQMAMMGVAPEMAGQEGPKQNPQEIKTSQEAIFSPESGGSTGQQMM